MNRGEVGGSLGGAEKPTPQPALIKRPASVAKGVPDEILNEILGATATAPVDVNAVKATPKQPQHLNEVEKQQITSPDVKFVHHVGGRSAEGRNPAPDTEPPNAVAKQVAGEALNEVTGKVEPSDIASEQIACTDARVVKVAGSGDAKKPTPQFVLMERPSSAAQQVVGEVRKEIIAKMDPSATAVEVVSVVRVSPAQLQPQPEAHRLQITPSEPSIIKLGEGDSGGEKSAPQSLSIRPSNMVAQQVAGEGVNNIVGKVERNGTASGVVSVVTLSPKQKAEKEEITSPEASAPKLIGRSSEGIIEKSIPQSASVEPPSSVAQQVTHEILNEIIGNVKRSATTGEVVHVSKASNSSQPPRKAGEQQTISPETSVEKLLQDETTVTILPDDPIALRLEADMTKAAAERDFSQLKLTLEASNQSEITRKGLQALAGTVLSQKAVNARKKTTSHMPDPQAVASSASTQMPDRSSVEHRYYTRGSTNNVPCNRKTGNEEREGGHSYKNTLNRRAYVPPKRTFVASKDFLSRGRKRRRNNADDKAPKIIYRCIQAKLPTQFEECKRLPVAYAMDLNDIEQQGQAMYLLGIENAKARRGQKTRYRSPTPASKTIAKKRRPKASLKAKYMLESELKNDIVHGAASRPIYEGPPDENLDGGWPPGWIKCIFRRQGGANTGYTYRYWYSPMNKKKFRSMVEIKRFMPLLAECRGDEEAAWKRFKVRDYAKELNGFEQEKRALNLPTNAKKARKGGKTCSKSPSVFTSVLQSKRQPFSEYPVKHDIARAPGSSFCVDDDDFDWTLPPGNDDSIIQIMDDQVTYFFLSILEAVSFYKNMPKDVPLANVRRRLILMPFDEWIPLCGMKWRKVTNNAEDAIWPEGPSSSNHRIDIIKEDTLTGRRLMGFDSIRAAHVDWCQARTTSPRLRKKATSLEFFKKQYLSGKKSVDGLVWRTLTKREQLKMKQQRDALFATKVNGTKTSDLSKSFPTNAKQPLESSPGLNSLPKKKTVTETLVKATAQPKGIPGGGTMDVEHREKLQEVSAQLVNAAVAPRNESDEIGEKPQIDAKRPLEASKGAGSPPKKCKTAPMPKQSTTPVAPVAEGGKEQVPQIADATITPREESHEKEENDPNCAIYPLELSAGAARPTKSKIATEMKQSTIAAAQPNCVAGGATIAITSTPVECKLRMPATWVADAAPEPCKTVEIAARFAEKPVEPSMDAKSLPKS